MIVAIFVLLLVFQTDAIVFSAAPDESGAWLLRNGVRLQMTPASFFAAKTRGFANYIYTDGYTNLDMDVSFAGPRAVLRISDRNPIFVVVPQAGDNYEPVLVSLKRKNDRRICRTRPDTASVGNKQGFRRQDIVRTILTVNPDKSFTVRPERPMKPGEYLLVTDSPAAGHDFGVD